MWLSLVHDCIRGLGACFDILQKLKKLNSPQLCTVETYLEISIVKLIVVLLDSHFFNTIFGDNLFKLMFLYFFLKSKTVLRVGNQFYKIEFWF